MNSSDKKVLMGIDVGTTSVKGAAYTFSGDCKFSKTVPYDVIKTGVADRVEQDPNSWMAAIKDIFAAVAAVLPQCSIAAMGVVSQVNTHVFVDAEGKPLLNAIVWQDQRCVDAAQQLDDKISDVLRETCWGKDFNVDASFLMSRAQWLYDTHPDLWEKTRWILSPKDYCLMCLTGQVATDAISSIGLVDQQGEYLLDAFALIPGLGEKLPPLKNITEITGCIDNTILSSGCPAVVSTMDAWGSVFGSGASGHGDAIQVAGTSEIIAAISKWNKGAEGVISFPPFDGWYLYAGPTQLGGSAATWFANFIGVGIEDVFALAGARPSKIAQSKKAPILFLPHIMGERAPLWDAKARGAFVGLDRRHDLGDMSKAVLEGVGFASRLLLGAIEKAAGFSVEQLKLSGGASRSDLWCQIKADILQKPLHRLKNTDTGTFGAALLAGLGAGIYVDISEAKNQAIAVQKIFMPDVQASDYYNALFSLYQQGYHALQPINTQLLALGKNNNAALNG